MYKVAVEIDSVFARAYLDSHAWLEMLLLLKEEFKAKLRDDIGSLKSILLANNFGCIGQIIRC
jgi:hypothetical protein